MSVLVHLCRTCGHQHSWHEPPNRGYTCCSCCRDGNADPDPEPTELPTMTTPGGIREGLWPPGSDRNVGTVHASRTCGCPRCHEAAARQTRRDHPLDAGRMEGLTGR